jgi:tRNA(fMet)-specific endonuclease VapC
MAIYLLDTETLTHYQRSHTQVVEAVANHSTDQLCLSSISIEEQISGWSGLSRSAKNYQEQEQAAILLSTIVVSWNRFAIVPITEPALLRFDLLVRAKLNVRYNDLRIAAIALELGAAVVTRNRRDFGRVPALKIEDWAR